MSGIGTHKDLSALFDQQVKATPDAVALEDDTTTWTYSELAHKVSTLANRLRSHGVGRDSLVGVLFKRSADYVLACLAVLRAGGAFLVLELAYPPSLLADVLEDAMPIVILTHAAHADQLKTKAVIPLIVLDAPDTDRNGSTAANSMANELTPLPADDDIERLAFVSYSSGTTGRPKGIANPHRAPVRSYAMRFGLSDLHPGDRVACNVFFIWEMLRPLLRGATVIAVPDEASYDPVALVDLLSFQRITETLMTPTLLAAVLSRHSQIGSQLPDLRTLWLNGEVVTTNLARAAIKALPKTRLLNCYSASETHEIACGDIRHMLDHHNSPFCPVGLPMDPDHTYVLNESGQRVAVGVSGELFVGGSFLARGYLNLPETTAKAFTPDPFNPTQGARMYKTGDLARLLPSGLIEITGRVGAMLKIRGYSIVPAKVQNAIVEQLAVSHCAVVAHGEDLERQLVAYIVCDKADPGDRTVPVIDATGYSPVSRRKLSTCLPQYMIPALWVELDELPTNGVSAKVDLNRLPPPTIAKSRNLALAQDVKIERNTETTLDTIAEMWAASLNTSCDAVKTKDHTFFDLGGHSLTLADLATRLSRSFGFQVPLSRLAGSPTLEGHLEVVCSARDGHTAAVQADLPDILRIDSVLPRDIQPSRVPMCPLSDANTVLLTGATGFLGGFLLSDLLESTSACIVCLVRFNNPSEDDKPAGMARLRKNLLDLGIWKDSMLDRIEILPGNLAHTRLGLSQDAFEDLAIRVQVIIHAGATVNLVYPYAALRSANVDGTREILRLACRGAATLQYISSNGVLPPSNSGWTEDSVIDLDTVSEKLFDGYGQTKWVSEQLIHEAGRRGLPVRILRPGTIGGHSTSGSTNTYDLITALIVESLNIGYVPDVEGWCVEMTPVDYVCKAILTISNYDHTEQRVFHIGDANPVSARVLFDNLNDLGYRTQRLAWEEWIALWTEERGSAKRGDGVFTIDILRGGMPTENFLKCITILNDDATKPVLAGLQRPKMDADLLETYARHWYSRGWLARPPRPRHSSNLALPLGPLRGRVAVITGASSGIGAAVAVALAAEGAHVALAARRIEALETMKGTLVGYGVKAIVHQTDVTDRVQVESLMRTADAELGPVDIVVACAGVMYWTMMKNVRINEWERMVDVNCKGLLYCLSSAVPLMLSRGGGHIVAISSDAGRKVFPGLGVYSASKFFVEATLQGLRVETAGTGLRVTSVQPGNTSTDLLGMSTDSEAIKKYGEPSGSKILNPEDVAASVIYALRQPPHVAVNEVLIEPRDEPM